MSTATPFRAVPRRPRGDKPGGIGAYCPNILHQDGPSVTLNSINPDLVPPSAASDMQGNATRATAFLKALAHEGRLMILCHLAAGEKSVGELEELLQMRQAAVSQMLARFARRRSGQHPTRRQDHYLFSSGWKRCAGDRADARTVLRDSHLTFSSIRTPR